MLRFGIRAAVVDWKHMALTRKAVGTAIATALLIASCSTDSAPHRDGARTYCESLDLSSPEATVTTLTDAFARDDFMTVWFTFDPFARSHLQNAIDLLQYRQVIGEGAMEDLRAWLQDDMFFESLEVRDQWYLFDQIMVIADSNDAFLIDLSDTVRIDAVEPMEDTVDTVHVSATVEGIEGEVVFVTTALIPNRWRIHQVIVPGGDKELYPWAVPPPTD